MNIQLLIKFEGAWSRGGFSMNWIILLFSILATPKFSTSTRGVSAMRIGAFIC